MLLSVYYTEDVTDVSLHPTGLYALVATVSRVIFCVVHVDTMKPKRSFDVPGGCPVAKFSDAGHMFAIVVDLSTVHVYSTITFQRLFEFANNKGAVSGHPRPLPGSAEFFVPFSDSDITYEIYAVLEASRSHILCPLVYRDITERRRAL